MRRQEAIARSSRYFETRVVPLLAETTLSGTWRAIETDPDSSVSLFDREHGCDWLLERPSGRRALVSSRCQFKGNNRNWTIRTATAGGGRTEIEKLVSEDGDVSPGWFVQSHAPDADSPPIDAAAIRVPDLARMLRAGAFYSIGGADASGYRNDDGSAWVFVRWEWATRDGVEWIHAPGPGYWETRAGRAEAREIAMPRLF